MKERQKRLNGGNGAMLDVNLMGQYGSGKGTQAKLLAGEYNLVHFSPGQALREHIKAGTDVGVRAKKIVEAGELVPAAIVRNIFEQALRQLEPGQGIIADGMTRNFEQKKMFDEISAQAGRHPVHIAIGISKDVAFDRLSKRKVCEGCGDVPILSAQDAAACKQCGGRVVTRHDDTPELIKKRLAIYDRDIAPVVDAYRTEGLLHEINGEQSVQAVHRDIVQLLEQQGFPHEHKEGAA